MPLWTYILSCEAGLPGLAIAGISIGGVAGVLLLVVGISVWYYRKKKVDSKLF